MSKTRFSVSIDEERADWLDANTHNKSAFIDNLLREYIEGGGNEGDAIARYRREQLQAEKRAAESRLDTIQEQLNSIEADIQTAEERKLEYFEQWADTTFGEPLSTDHVIVQDAASDVGMAADELLAEYREWSQ